MHYKVEFLFTLSKHCKYLLILSFYASEEVKKLSSLFNNKSKSKKKTSKEIWPDCVLPRKSVLAERPVGGVAQTNVIWRLGINLRSPETIRLKILDASVVQK